MNGMHKLLNFSKKYQSAFVLLSIFFLAITLRCLFLKENFLFGFEQGRDAQIARDILSLKKLTLIGPKTDIDGIFHGVGYYYFISILYKLGGGSPLFVLYFLIFLNSASLFFVYNTARLLIKERVYAYLAALMFAVSFNAIIYAQWLSNVSPSIFLTSVFVYSLACFLIGRNNRYWYISAFVLGLLFHFELLHGLYGLFALFILYFIFRSRFSLKMLLGGVGILMLLTSTFIFFELRHQFLMTHNVISYILRGNHGAHANIFVYFQGLFNEIETAFFLANRTVFTVSALILIGSSVYFSLTHKHIFGKEKMKWYFLVVMALWSFPFILLIKEHPLEHFYAGTLIPVILLTTMLIKYNLPVLKKLLTLLLPLWLVSSVFITYQSLKATKNVFYHNVQPTYHYQDQINLITFMFQYTRQGFDYDAFTIPYFNKQAWEYLYQWIGQSRYDEVFIINTRTLSPQQKKYYILIIEPSTNGKYLDQWIASYKQKYQFIDSKKFGDIRMIIALNSKRI